MLVPTGEEEAGTVQLVGWFRLNHGLLQLLLRILLSAPLSSSSPPASTTQAPSTTLLLWKFSALLLLVLELGGLIACRFNHAEFICSLLVIAGHTCSPVSLPRGPHHVNYLFRY